MNPLARPPRATRLHRTVVLEGVRFREGGPDDLEQTFAIAERTIHATAVDLGLLSGDHVPSDSEIRARWKRYRSLIEFMAARPGGRYLICEREGEPVGYARVVCLGRTEQLSELMVTPVCQGLGIGQALLERVWPAEAEQGWRRVVVATGAPKDLSLYTAHDLTPVAGHWHMRQQPRAYLQRRSEEAPSKDNATCALDADAACQVWSRLEPAVIADRRAELHEFFARTRGCVGLISDGGHARAACWIGPSGEVGPAIGETSPEVCETVLRALDLVASSGQSDSLSVVCATANEALMRRLRGLGFRVYWPSWIMASEPVPGLDRYVPTRPPHLL